MCEPPLTRALPSAQQLSIVVVSLKKCGGASESLPNTLEEGHSTQFGNHQSKLLISVQTPEGSLIASCKFMGE